MYDARIVRGNTYANIVSSKATETAKRHPPRPKKLSIKKSIVTKSKQKSTFIDGTF